MIVVMIASIVAFILWLPRKTHVNITGRVVDGEREQPIANARVIVTLVRNGFPYDSYMGYGLVTDAKGDFQLDTDPPRSFSDVFIEASTPANEYAKVNAQEEARVVLRTSAIPANKRNSPRFRYDNFRGLAGFGVGNELIFIGQSW
jgi:hypothetical protein